MEFLNFVCPNKKLCNTKIDSIRKLGVKIETNVIVGRTVTIEELFEEEDFKEKVYRFRAGLPMFMGIPGKMQWRVVCK